jgi:hypothetical protein
MDVTTADLLFMTLDDMHQDKGQQNQAAHVQKNPQLRHKKLALEVSPLVNMNDSSSVMKNNEPSCNILFHRDISKPAG